MGEALSVVVLSKNNEYTIKPCIASVLKALPLTKEVVVVDASTDTSAEYLRSLKGVKYVREEGRGIGYARNLGVRHSSGKIVCFVDADAIVERFHFLKILNVFNADPQVGAVSVNPKYRFDGMNKLQRLEYLIREQRRLKGDEHLEGYSFMAEGCFLSLRREVWEKCKFWDVKYGADDWDFSMKILSNGWKIYSIDAESIHIPRATVKSLFKEQFGWGKGMKEFYKKHSKTYASYAYRKRKIAKISKNPFIVSTFIHLFSPIVALKYAFGAKDIQLLPYYVHRQFSFLLGLILG